jgi:hypothetical protein
VLVRGFAPIATRADPPTGGRDFDLARSAGRSVSNARRARRSDSPRGDDGRAGANEKGVSLVVVHGRIARRTAGPVQRGGTVPVAYAAEPREPRDVDGAPRRNWRRTGGPRGSENRDERHDGGAWTIARRTAGPVQRGGTVPVAYAAEPREQRDVDGAPRRNWRRTGGPRGSENRDERHDGGIRESAGRRRSTAP